MFPPTWILGLVGAIYFLYLLQQDFLFWKKMLGAWLAWTIKVAFSVSWMWSVYPVEWLPLELSDVQLVVIGFSWFMTAVTAGMGVLFLVGISELLHRKTDLPRWSYYVLLYPLLWVIAESVGSVIFSIFFYGPGGTIGSAFSFGYVGYLLAHHEGLLFIAKVAGVYGLTISLLCVAGVSLWCLEQYPKYRYVVLITVVMLSGSSFLFIPEIVIPATNATYSVITIDTHFDANTVRTEAGRKQATEGLEAAMEKALAKDPDYIILPEDSRYFDQTVPLSTTKANFKKKYSESDVIIVDSGRSVYNKETVLQAFIYNGSENPVERYHKQYLVPQGEFIPNIYRILFQLVGYSGSLEYLSETISYRVGPWTSQKEAGEKTPGILFCFESFAPRGIKTLVEERLQMPFVAHIASHAWFHTPYTLWSQMELMLQVQAVWSKQYMVSVGNMMSGKLYTPDGSIEEMEVIEKGAGWEMKQVYIPM